MIYDVNLNRTQILPFILVILLFTIAVVIYRPTIQPEYVNSIYEMYPSGFYWLLNMTIVCTLLLYYISIHNEDKTVEYISVISYFIWLILFYILTKSKPVIYGNSQHDTFYHLGIIFYTMDNGFHPGGDIYPGTHLLSVIILRLTNIPIFNLEPGLAIFHRIIFIVGVLIYTRYLWGSKAGKISIIVSAPFVFGISSRTLAPFSISFSLLPLALFVFHTMNDKLYDSKRWSIIFIAFLLGITLLHPLATIYLNIFLVLYYASARTWEHIASKEMNLKTYPITLAILIIGGWMMFNKMLFELTTSVIIGNLVGDSTSSGDSSNSAVGASSSGSSNSVIEVYINSLNSSPANISTLIYEVVIVEYGAIILFGILSFSVFLYILFVFQIDELDFELYYSILLYISSVIMFVGLLIFYAVIGSPTRAVRLAMFVSILLLTYAIFTFNTNNEIVARTLVVFVLLTMVISTPVVYPTNFHTYPSTIEGSGWSHSYHDDHRTDSYLSSKLSYFTLRGDVSDRDLLFKPTGENDPPRNLGYAENRTYGGNSTQEKYLILTRMDFIRHKPHSKVRWQGFDWLISKQAKNNLRQDESMQKLYTSSQYTVWKTRRD